jgi:hypothetical protein
MTLHIHVHTNTQPLTLQTRASIILQFTFHKKESHVYENGHSKQHVNMSSQLLLNG